MNLSRQEKIKERTTSFINKINRSLVKRANSEFTKKFTGPSQYFPEQSLICASNPKEFLGDRHIEMIYAVLPAWGMHRMGDQEAKVPEFSKFRKSILENEETLKDLRLRRIVDNDLEDVLRNKLNKILGKIKGSESNIKLVANSKILAHILPKLVPPIDRAYTLNFFFRSTYINQDLKEQKDLFFHLLLQMKRIAQKVASLGYEEGLPKMVDNLIIWEVFSNPDIYSKLKKRRKRKKV